MPPSKAGLAREIESRYFTPAQRNQRRAVLWKDALRAHVGADGELLWRGLLGIANGEAWVPKLAGADGIVREGPPQVPTTMDRFVALRFLAEALFGKAPTQEKIAEAERAAAENQDLRTMSDAELEGHVRRALLTHGESAEGETTEALPETSGDKP